MDIENKIQELRIKLETDLNSCKDLIRLEEVRLEFFSRKGLISQFMSLMKDFSIEQKRIYGPLLNNFKQEFENKFNEKKEFILSESFLKIEELEKDFDVTAYKPNQLKGSLHVHSYLTQKVEDIFISMGYEVVQGPEIENDFYNFESLNIPKNHPARDMQDTFWFDVPGMLFRTHTSTVQIRQMQKRTPPFALISTGRVFRNEATDASHDYQFRQFEGMVIAENISIAHLLGTYKLFLQKFFQKEELSIRVRPSYFPFVEPGLEIDMSCPFCQNGCSTCKQTKWIEICGAGLIHPEVLKHGGIDTQKYSGFAFGTGLTRLAMIYYNINDIRLLHTADLDFLKQF